MGEDEKIFMNDEKKSYSIETAVLISDLHVPFHNRKALASIYNLCSDIQPDKIVQLGDMCDCAALSSFSKSPERAQSFQQELDEAIKIWDTLHQICPAAEKFYVEGNHEERLPRYIFARPELVPLRALRIENLMELDRFGVKYYRKNELLCLNDVLICTHGTTVRSNPGASALAELNKYRKSGTSGHCHRTGLVFQSCGDTTNFWAELGWLGDFSKAAEYQGNIPNPWSTSIGIATFWRESARSKKKKNWNVSVDVINFVNDSFLYKDKIYTPVGIFS